MNGPCLCGDPYCPRCFASLPPAEDPRGRLRRLVRRIGCHVFGHDDDPWGECRACGDRNARAYVAALAAEAQLYEYDPEGLDREEAARYAADQADDLEARFDRESLAFPL